MQIYLYMYYYQIAEDAKYIFVGFPIDNNIEYVLAFINSTKRYGSGLILAFLENKQIKGVKVNITISLDVNIVRIETRK